jgi:hypothetical protein
VTATVRSCLARVRARTGTAVSKVCQKYPIPSDVGYFSKHANLLFLRYSPDAADYATPGETWITGSGKHRNENDLSLKSLKSMPKKE